MSTHGCATRASRWRGPADSWQAGARLGRQLQGADLRAVFVLSDGLAVNGTPLLDGLTQNLPEGVAVSGGLAGDGSRFQRTWVLDGASPRQHCICAVGFYGERLRIGHGHDGGWSDFGPERRITALRGQRALRTRRPAGARPVQGLPRRARGRAARHRAAVPAVAAPRRTGPASRWCAPSSASTRQRRSMTFAGDMPQGAVARLMRTSNDRPDRKRRATRRRQATQGLGHRPRRWSIRSAASAADWCWASGPKRRSRPCSTARPAGRQRSASTPTARSPPVQGRRRQRAAQPDHDRHDHRRTGLTA